MGLRCRDAAAQLLVCLGCAIAVPGCGDGPSGMPLRTLPTDSDPAWSPDGQWIAFSHEGSDSRSWGLYVARIDGSERRLVVRDGHSPDWSPDGSSLLLGSSGQLYILDLTTDSLRQLTDTGFFNGPSAWSPDGQTIAFGSDGAYGRGDPGLWLMQNDGSQTRRLHFERGGYADWAPSGEKLVTGGAFFTTPPALVHRIAVVDTLGIDTLWLNPPTFDADQPAWSPTGEWIAYVRDLGVHSSGIHLVRPNGTGDHFLVQGTYPTFSPDGQHVAFSRYAGDEIAIWSVGLNGQNLRQLSWPRALVTPQH